jgi:CMP-N,N'-diacetyllegionaminic acid synthase
MYNNKSFLAIIPARGGSKGLPKKNIKKLKGIPLIGWTINSALESKYLDNILVSSDDEEIISISKKFGLDVPFKRPDELADDKSTSFSVVEHAIEFLKNDGKTYDFIVLLEPTSPLRESSDIDQMIKKIVLNSKFDAIVSVGEVSLHPSSMKKINNDSTIENFCKNIKNSTRRQDNKKAYFPFGVAYIVKTNVLLETKTFYPKNSTYFKINRHQCFEIDDIYDFITIEKIIEYEKI